MGRRKYEYKSFGRFISSFTKTFNFFTSLKVNAKVVERFIEDFDSDEQHLSKKQRDLLLLGAKNEPYLYEIGFIALLSNFEFFMYELVKELVDRHPEVIKNEPALTYGDIKRFKSLSRLNKHYLDKFAIGKSKGLESWIEYLNKTFKITVFRNNQHYKRMIMLNGLRNVFLHGGSKTNAEFKDQLSRIVSSEIPLNKKITLDRKQYFRNLYRELTSLRVRNLQDNEVNVV